MWCDHSNCKVAIHSINIVLAMCEKDIEKDDNKSYQILGISYWLWT